MSFSNRKKSQNKTNKETLTDGIRVEISQAGLQGIQGLFPTLSIRKK
jgi:hypothetical protein